MRTIVRSIAIPLLVHFTHLDLHVDQYHCLEDPASAFDNVELQPDGASDAGTAFTRYTVAAPTLATTRDTRTT